MSAGVDDVNELATMRPAELASVPSISEDMATVIVEGARELTRATEPVADKLAQQTGADREELSKVLSMLAASGVPGSGAEATLRELYGPSIIEVDGVDGRMAYFLHEAGYTTPWELSEASVEELEEVNQLGPVTAERVQEGARKLLSN